MLKPKKKPGKNAEKVKQLVSHLSVRFNAARSPSLSRDYFFFATAIAVAVVLLSAGFSISIYFSEQNYKKQRLNEQSAQIERIVLENFDYIERMSNVLGKRIAEQNDADPEFIANLYRNTTLPDVDQKNAFSWSLFDWVNHNNLQLVNTRLGVVRFRPEDMSLRSYTKKCRTHPWVLQISKPAMGYPSSQWVIPVALGVTNDRGEYMGAVVSGVNVGKLTRQIGQILQDNVSFTIIGEDMGKDADVVLHSDNVLVPGEKDRKELVSKFTAAQKKLTKEGKLSKEITFGDTSFVVQKRFERYPYHVLMGYNRSVAWQDFLNILFPRLLEFTGMGVFCFVLLMFFRRKIIVPIKRLSDSADKMSQGKAGTDVSRCGIYELDVLAWQLDQVGQYVAELQRVREELAIKSEAAEAANRAKSEFLACVSHELRTPLNAVIAFAEIVKTEMFGQLGNKKYREYVDDIHRSGTHLLKIINDILDVSRAEAGKIILRKKRLSILRVIEMCLAEVAVNAAEGGVSIEVALDKHLPCIVSDESRLKQIITNLLSNAVKFTPVGGRASISAKATMREGKVTDYYIMIQDTGIGMKEEDIPRATEKFGQLDAGLNRKFEGIGLGLPLTKKLIEIHNGQLIINSTVNKGTIVTVHFPQDHYEVVPKEERVLEMVG